MTVGWIVADSPTPRSLSSAERVVALEAEGLDVDLHEVRLDAIRGRPGTPAAASPSAERARAGVVVGETLDVVVERVDAGRGDDPRLAHRAAEEVLLAPGALDELLGACQERSERAAEPLRQAERDGVEAGGDLGRRDALRRRGVQEAGAVEVHGEPELAGRSRTSSSSSSGHTRPPALLCVSSSERTLAR